MKALKISSALAAGIPVDINESYEVNTRWDDMVAYLQDGGWQVDISYVRGMEGFGYDCQIHCPITGTVIHGIGDSRQDAFKIAYRRASKERRGDFQEAIRTVVRVGKERKALDAGTVEAGVVFQEDACKPRRL